MSELKLDAVDSDSVRDLVASDEIERWIDDQSYAEECFAEGSGTDVSGEDLLDAGAELLRADRSHEAKETKGSEERSGNFDSSLATLKRMTDGL
jgi:hypothetical protein